MVALKKVRQARDSNQDRDVTFDHAEAQHRGRVVTRSGAEHDAMRSFSGLGSHRNDAREDRAVPEFEFEFEFKEVEPISAADWQPISGAGCVRTVGGQTCKSGSSRSKAVPGKSPGELIVGRCYRSDPSSVRRLTEQVESRWGRSGVVPEDRDSDDGAVRVEDYHSVLLGADSDRRNIGQAARIRDRDLEGVPPVVGVDLGAVKVRRTPAVDEAPVSASRMMIFHAWVEKSIPVTSVIGHQGFLRWVQRPGRSRGRAGWRVCDGHRGGAGVPKLGRTPLRR